MRLIFISHNAERHIDSGTSERGDRNVDVAVRASVPYPESLFLDTVMNFETENTTNLSEPFGTAIDVETEHHPYSYESRGIDTDVMDTEISNNDTGTGWAEIESIQDMRMGETVCRAFHDTCFANARR
jgi:hypothetical protein